MELTSARRVRATAAAHARGTLDAGDAAWIAALPCAALTLAAIVLLGVPLGDALFAPRAGATFLPGIWVAPEPGEHARYALALCGAFALPTLVLATRGRLPALPRPWTRALVATAQTAAVACIALGVLAQARLFGSIEPLDNRIFTPRTLIAAALLPALALAALRRPRVATAVARATANETRRLRIACTLAAVALTTVWLSTAIYSDATIHDQIGANLIPWDMDETFAVLDGRTPLVDFHAQYAQLWPYVAAAVMALLGGSSLTLWTLVMTTISGTALLAIHAVLRRVAGSALLALSLYVPLLATSFFIGLKPLDHRFSPAGIFSAWPLRYAGPYLLAWLTARHLDGAAPRRAWLLLAAAGLVLLNNAELGIPAFAATLVVLVLLRAPDGARAMARAVAEALAGLLLAGALVALLTLARTGRLPDYGLLLEFPRIYGVGGWVLTRMPTVGLYLALLVTFAGALTTAAVRVARGARDLLLTGMLAWSGAFGLLAGSFYVGRSEPLQLIVLLSAWCLALVLLLVPVVRELAARGWRRPTLPQLAVLFGFGLAVCSLPQIPTPWSQVARLRAHAAEPGFARAAALHLIARDTHPGETVMLLVPLGHRIAYRLHLRNVAPYSGAEAMPTREQVADAVALARRLQLPHVFVGIFDATGGNTLPAIVAAFGQAGYVPRGAAGSVTMLSR